jgi:hypothetical protein
MAEVKVELEDGGLLVISSQRNREKEDKGDRWHRVERSSGQFERRFWLLDDAKVDQVKARLENGMLTPSRRGVGIAAVERSSHQALRDWAEELLVCVCLLLVV